MASSDGEKSSNLKEMLPAETNSESSRLISSDSMSNPSYINIISNVCSFIFLFIITYCCFKDNVVLFSFHPVLMTLGWIDLMTTAINALSPGDIVTSWMPIRLRSARHWVLQLLSGITVIIGFFIILSNKIINEKSHFQTLHAKFGLASIVFMIGTMFGGLCTLYGLKLKQYVAPVYIKLLHASFGILTFSLGVITIFLGLFSSWWSFGDILRYTSIVLVSVVTVCTILRPTLKIYFRLKERYDSAN